MKFRAAFLAASVLALTGSISWAQEPATTTPDTAASLTASGTVVSSGTTSVIVRLDDGTERTFAVDSRSSVPQGLAVGTRVTVNYASEAGGYRALTVMTGATTPANMNTTDTTTDPATLPATASALPLIAAAGVLFLTTALLMGSAERRRA